jgi:NAD+ diphosphatase
LPIRPILNAPPHVYASVGLDRAAAWRKDPRWLERARRDPATRVVLVSRLRVPVREDPAAGPRLVTFSAAEIDPGPEPVLLGIVDGVPVLARAWPDEPPLGAPAFVELRQVGAALPRREAGLLAQARGLFHWHDRHRFCGACGAPTMVVQAGHARLCPACGTETFPRTDPAMIVLVTHGDRALLARSARFPPGMYSTLAGFVEPGESLEDTVRREVLEEAGVAVGAITYRSSQPWPFPQSLMVGFRAQALSTELRLDPDELEDALWLERAVLADPERCPVRLPGPDSIARFLIEEWLAEA